MRFWTFIIGIICYILGNSACAQLYTQYTYPNTVYNTVLNQFAGPGVQISNVQFTGFNLNSNAEIRDIGTFNAQNTNLGVDSGIILTSGFLAPPYGLGVPASNSADFIKNTYGDSLLNTLIAPYYTVNAVVLEFDFIPNGDSIKFNYVFASDEYNQDVCNVNNDVFAFHISGPGIAGNENIAVIPGTSLPVSINSINNGNAGGFWLPSNCISLGYAQYFVDHTSDTNFIFNGSTSVLTATAPTVPCQTYHMRFAVADGGDTYENSAVFLIANSFNSEPIQISSTVSYGGPDTLLYEACGYANLVIKRTYNIQSAKTYTVQYSGSATYGIDYSAAPTSITMLPGQMYDTIQIIPFGDLLPDNGETLIVSVGDTLCNGDYYVSDIELLINEKQGLTVNILPDNGNFCDSVDFIPVVSGAIPPLQYSWNPGGSTDTLMTFFDNGSLAITVTVTDACGQTAYDTAFVTMGDSPTANFIYNPLYSDILHPTVNFIDASSTDATNWLWDLGEGGMSTEQNPSYTYVFPDTNTIILIITNSLGCTDTAIQILIIHDFPGIYIPNAFTPNDDAVNDVFMVYGREIAFFNMQIFDRWGNRVFQTQNPNSGWGGTYNTLPVSPGVYSILVEYSFSNNPNEIRTLIERVHLIR